MPAPTLVTPEFDPIAQVIKTHLEGITNAGKVYLRRRNPRFWNNIMESQVAAGQLNVWEVFLDGINTRIPVEGGGTGNLPLRQRDYSVVIAGRLAFRDGTDDDNSTNQFHAMIEEIENAILTDYFLTGTLIKPIIRIDTQIGEFEMRNDVMVHNCLMAFTAVVRKQGL